MNQSVFRFAAFALALLGADVAAAQHAGHETHGQSAPSAALPQEPGQGAFAAIAEIVAILAADPETDWSRVDIAALQLHLADMNALALGATVVVQDVSNGVALTISLDGRAGEAAGRMVPAHGPVLASETGWVSNVEKQAKTVLWTVTDPTGSDVAQIKALGFFGLMATGDHHRAHHLALAMTGAAH